MQNYYTTVSLKPQEKKRGDEVIKIKASYEKTKDFDRLKALLRPYIVEMKQDKHSKGQGAYMRTYLKLELDRGKNTKI